MRQLESLHLRRYVVFDKVDFRFTPGITTILGLNKDAASGSTNAAGKSALISAIPEIVLDESPSGKDSVKSKIKSVLGIQLVNDGNRYRVSKTMGSRKSYKIERNDRDSHIRTIAYSKEKLQRLFGMTEQEFYTRFFIDSTIPHPLIRGTAAQREAFLVGMFNLDDINHVRKLLLAEIAEMQRTAAVLAEVKAQYDAASADVVSDTEYAELEERAAKLKAKQKKLASQVQESQRISELLVFAEAQSDLIKWYVKHVAAFGLEFDDQYRKERQVLKSVNTELASLGEWREHATELRVWKKAARRFKDFCAERQLDYKHVDRHLAAAKATKRKYEELGAKLDELTAQLSTVEKVKPIEVKYSKVKCSVQIEKLLEERAHAKQFKTGKCPTCGAPAKHRPPEDIEQELTKWRTLHDKAIEAERADTVIRQREEWQALYDALSSDLAALGDVDEQGRIKDLEAASLLKAQIPSKPDAPEGEQPKHTEEELNEQRDKLRSSIERFRQCEPLVNRIREVLALSKEQKAQAQEFRDLAPKLTAISSELAQVESKLVHQREARSQIKNLKQRVKTLSAQCEDLPILKAFADVYSKTGLRQYMIKRYAALLEEQVNKFRRLFFAEPYTFEFRYNKRLDILVHRKMGLTSDVKRLSGAEKRMFTLLLVIADVVLKPNTKRIDTLILDEPESNLGPAALDAFIKALPVLNKLFPKIVILTPRPDLEVPGARIVTVVKRGGKATLIEGRPK